MNEIEERFYNECNVFKAENATSEEIGYFIYKNYIVSVYKLLPIVSKDDEATFENVYAILDLDTNEVFDEFCHSRKSLFEELPEIDNVLFNCSFENKEAMEKAKKVVKEAVFSFYKNRTISKRYKDELRVISELVDVSSKEFYNFFINNI